MVSDSCQMKKFPSSGKVFNEVTPKYLSSSFLPTENDFQLCNLCDVLFINLQCEEADWTPPTL